MGSVEERLAVVETTVGFIRAEVSEVKTDVKTILGYWNQNAGRFSLGKYILPFTAVVISIAAFVIR